MLAVASMFFLISSDFGPVPQDCMAVSFSVQGYVVTEDHDPIHNASVHVWDDRSYELTAFTNDEGYFRTESVFSFACYEFQVEVFADGFVSKTFSYYPPAEGFSDELPNEMNVQLQSLSDEIDSTR